MNNRILKGIALILFGILLCVGGPEINDIIFHSIQDLPFSIIGVTLGIIGLVMVFSNNAKEER